MASERDKKQRLEDNKGVRDGTIRKGKGGKSIRKYDAKSGRWKKVSVRGATKRYGSVLKRGGKNDSGSRQQTSYNPGGKPTRTKESVLEAAKKRNEARKDAMSKEGRKKAKDKYAPSYQTGSKGGKTYDRAMRKAKGKVDTPGERGMDVLDRKIKSITDPASRRGRDAIVKANNEKVRIRNEQRRKEYQDALKTSVKNLAEKKSKYR